MAKQAIIGDCEVCDKSRVEIWNTRGNINMCIDCKAENDAVIMIQEESVAGNKVIQQMRAIDTQSELKADLFNQSTVAIIELHGAIWADDSIPQERKQYVYTQECAKHFEVSQKRVFELRQEVLAEENIQRAWQVAAQTAAGQLTLVEREHFKKLNVAYQPATVKTVKPAKSKAPSKNYKGNELREACAKYNVPAQIIQLMVLQRGMSAEAAAKEFAEVQAARKAAQAN